MLDSLRPSEVLDDVGACLHVGPMDAGNDIGSSVGEQMAISLEIFGPIRNAFAAIIPLIEIVTLDHGNR